MRDSVDDDMDEHIGRSPYYFVIMLIVSWMTTIDGLHVDPMAFAFIYMVTVYWGVVTLERIFFHRFLHR